MSSLWELIGIVGGIVFFGRFYVQWYVSERLKRSVVPLAFWYMSSVGVLLLLPYAVFWKQSPVGALSYAFNLVVYARNLVHIWREKGTLTPRRNTGIHVAVALISVVAVVLVAYTWLNEFHDTRSHPPKVMAQMWLFIALGTVGQLLFGCRFLVQWVATEKERKSVIPVAFWHLSVLASVLQIVSYVPRQEWVFALGLLATLPVYLRNLWLIYLHKAPAPAGD